MFTDGSELCLGVLIDRHGGKDEFRSFDPIMWRRRPWLCHEKKNSCVDPPESAHKSSERDLGFLDLSDCVEQSSE